MPLRVILEPRLSAEDAAAYDAFVERAAGGHFSQTREWHDIARAGKYVHSTYFLALDGREPIGAALVMRPRMGIVTAPFAFVERGPVCARPRDLSRVLPALSEALRKRGVARSYVMPYFSGAEKVVADEALTHARFRDVQTPSGAHVRTLRLSLAGKDDEDLFGGGEREALRRKLKQAEKAGLRVRRGTASDVPALALLHREMMRAQKRRSKSRAYFSAIASHLDRHGRGALFVAEHEGEAMSAVFAVRHGALATFVLGASSSSQKPFSKMAPAMAEAIRWALAQGCEAFDLGGLPREDDRDPKRASIAQFKLDFAKTPIDLVSEHARWF